MNEEQLRQIYEQLRARGHTMSLDELRAEIGLPQPAQATQQPQQSPGFMGPPQPEKKHPLDITDPESGVRRFARAAGGPFSDELAWLGGALKKNWTAGPGESLAEMGQAGAQARARSKELMAEQRQEHPWLSLGTELGAAALIPGGAASTAKTLGQAMLRGGTAGAVTGGLLGAAESEGGLVGRGIGGLFGAGVGGFAGAAGPAIAASPQFIGKLMGSGPLRAAKAMRKGVKLSDDINAAFKAADDRLKEISTTLYQPLERKFDAISDPVITGLLQREDFAPAVGRALGDKKRTQQILEGASPSLKELQSIRSYLMSQRDVMSRKGNKFMASRRGGQIDELTEALGQYPEVKAADQAWFQANRVKDALNEGSKMWNAKSAPVQRALANPAYDEAAQNAFRQGMLWRTVAELETRTDEAGAAFQKMLKSGPETHRLLRTMFPDDASFAAFMKEIEGEKSGLLVKNALKRWALFGAGAAGAGLIAGFVSQ